MQIPVVVAQGLFGRLEMEAQIRPAHPIHRLVGPQLAPTQLQCNCNANSKVKPARDGSGKTSRTKKQRDERLNNPDTRKVLVMLMLLELTRAFREVGDTDAGGVIIAANGP